MCVCVCTCEYVYVHVHVHVHVHVYVLHRLITFSVHVHVLFGLISNLSLHFGCEHSISQQYLWVSFGHPILFVKYMQMYWKLNIWTPSFSKNNKFGHPIFKSWLIHWLWEFYFIHTYIWWSCCCWFTPALIALTLLWFDLHVSSKPFKICLLAKWLSICLNLSKPSIIFCYCTTTPFNTLWKDLKGRTIGLWYVCSESCFTFQRSLLSDSFLTFQNPSV